MDMERKSEAQTVFDLTQIDKIPHVLVEGGTPYLVVAGGAQIENVERFLPQPTSTRRQVNLTEMSSFIDYLKAHGSPSSAVFADEKKLSMMAIIDEDVRGDPQWRLHRAHLQLSHSDAWKAWIGMNKKPVEQDTFAEFIEDNAVDVITPSPAEMMELARNLEINRKVTYTGVVRTENGTLNLNYSVEDKASARKDRIEVPERFMISIPVYQGDETNVTIEARFRYRLTDQGLKLYYDLYRIQDVLQMAWAQTCERIAFDGKPLIYQGSPGTS